MEDSIAGQAIGIIISVLAVLILAVLKLAEIGVVASWSWWWLTSPLWGPIAIWLAIVLMVRVIDVISECFS